MWSDQNIVKALLSGNQKEDSAALKILYTDQNSRRLITKLILQQGGTNEDVPAIFNEALALLCQHVRQGRYQLEKGAIVPYFVGIAKQLYHTRSRSERRLKARERSFSLDQGTPPATPEEVLDRIEEKALLATALAAIGEKCNELLRHYSLRYSMREMQLHFTYKSVASAKMAVFACRKKLRDYLKKKPKLRAALIEYYQHG